MTIRSRRSTAAALAVPMAALAAILAAVLIAAPPAGAAKPPAESALTIPFEPPAPVQVLPGRRAAAAAGNAVALHGVGYHAHAGTPEDMARQYLTDAAGALGLAQPDLSDLAVHAVRPGPSGTVVRFRQSVGGVPVYGPDLAVKLDRDDVVTFVTSSYRPGIELDDDAAPAIAAGAARDAAVAYLGVQGGVEWQRTRLVVFPGAAGARLTWQVDLAARLAPAGEWRVMVDAVSGEIFGAEDRANYGTTVDGTATVFDPDPLSSAGATYGDTGFIDSTNPPTEEDTAQLTAETFARTLLDITDNAGTFSLVGPWAECVDWASPFKGCFSQGSSAWSFTREPDAFEAANTYYHIDTYMRYLNVTLGLNLEPFQYAGGVQYDPHGFNGADNSSYSPGTGRLQFGEGGVDDAEDADVVIHELGHGLHDWATIGGGSQTEGLGEGIGDFCAAEYSRSFGQWGAGDPQNQWVFSWDGHNEFWPGRVTNWTDTHTYPGGLTGSIHTDGQFWSSCNMQVWDAIGRDLTVTAHWEGIAMTNGGSNQLAAAQAVVQASIDLGYDPADIAQIVAIYQGCGYQVTAPAIFEDGFESGDTTAWSSTMP